MIVLHHRSPRPLDRLTPRRQPRHSTNRTQLRLRQLAVDSSLGRDERELGDWGDEDGGEVGVEVGVEDGGWGGGHGGLEGGDLGGEQVLVGDGLKPLIVPLCDLETLGLPDDLNLCAPWYYILGCVGAAYYYCMVHACYNE